MSKMNILKATIEDADEIFLLDKKYLGDGWSKKSIEEIIQNDNSIKIYIAKDEIIKAYVIFRIVENEIELLRIAVEEASRNRDIATKLLRYIINVFDIKKVFLEVRESNNIAINFYKKQGFIKIGIRKSFYNNPKENAISMKLKIE